VYNLALDQRNLAKSPEPLPSLLDIWQKRVADKEKDIKPERKEVDFEEEREKPIVHKINYQFQSPQMTVLRKDVEWMQDVPFSCLQESLRVLQTAFKNFFDRVKKGQRVSDVKNPYGFPRYRNRYRLSIPFKPVNVKIKVFSEKVSGEEGQYFSEIQIPLIESLIKMRQDRPILGKLKTPTIKYEGDGKWYVVILTEQEIPDPVKPEGYIGIDMGVKHLATTSEGVHYPVTEKNIKTKVHIEDIEKKIRRIQTACDKRKIKFSANWKKEKRKIAKLKNKQMKCRNELHHEITNEITNNYGKIAVEDLQIKNMTAKASGTVEDPGSNVAQKEGLNRVILERGWGNFFRQLEYKSTWKGGELVKVDPKYTSQQCSQCGHTSSENRKVQDKFSCVECGHSENADINAAKNILQRI